jgi:exodeoxyribonuclease V beta subunit
MSDLKTLDVFNVPLRGISLVEASAGTGKTYNIASLYVRVLLELDLEPSQILVMTFTEAATAELKLRLRDRIKASLAMLKGEKTPDDEFFESLIAADYEMAEEKLKRSLDTFDEAAVFTIHGFCNRLLTEYSVQFDVPPNVELLTNSDELLQECVDEYWIEFNQNAEVDTLQWFTLNYLIDRGFGPDELKDVVGKVMGKTKARVVPDIRLHSLKPILDEMMEVYFRTRDQWKVDKESLKEILFSGHLNGNRYNKNKLNEYWNALTEWIECEEFTFEYPAELSKFSLYLFESFNKSAPDYEVLDVCRSIERFLELAENLSSLKIAFINESVMAIQDRFNNLKSNRQVLSYDDMLTKVEEGLCSESSASLRRRLADKYPFALVDEFQDTDKIQYNILKSIYQNRPSTGLFMIGDPKQAIYSFRGADVYTYLEAKSDVTNDQAYGLTSNFRSNSKMIEGVNQLFSGSQNSFIEKDIQFQKATFPKSKADENYLYNKLGHKINPLQFIGIDEESYSNKTQLKDDIYSALTREILNLLSGDYRLKIGDSKELIEVKEKDIAILVWKGADGEKIQEILREAGIKSVLRSNSSVFSTEESKDLFRVLNAILNLSHESGIKAALVSPLIGYDALDLLSLDEDENLWAGLISRLTDVRDEWNRNGIESSLNLFFETFKVLENLSTLKNAERKISNLLHLTELLSQESRINRFSPKALLRWYYSKLNEDNNSGKAKDEEQMRLESDEDLVQITTMHSAKGLQYPIVFCPFLWSSKVIKGNESTISFKKDGETFIDLSGSMDHRNKDEFVQLAREQNMAEDVRLAYVSLTRSISACYVFLPDYNKIENSPISYIMNGKEVSPSVDFDTIKTQLEAKDQIDIRQPVIEIKKKKAEDELNKMILRAESLKRKDLFDYPRMLSYTALVSGHGDDFSGKDHDRAFFGTHNGSEDAVKSLNRFSFPKGANAGSFLHQIFEDMSFQKEEERLEIIRHNLDRFGFSEDWEGEVRVWVEETLNQNLCTPDISLIDLNEDQVIKEMEFFFPVNDLQVREIWRLIRLRHSEETVHESFRGFLKGYIDLIFSWKGKYYILDYKSNHLGNKIEDYTTPALKTAVKDAGYDLQYHLYTLALDRYLASRLNDYNYEDHFGGVLYLFLRGINPKQPGSGVFFDKPDAKLIQKLNEVVKGGNP